MAVLGRGEGCKKRKLGRLRSLLFWLPIFITTLTLTFGRLVNGWHLKKLSVRKLLLLLAFFARSKRIGMLQKLSELLRLKKLGRRTLLLDLRLIIAICPKVVTERPEKIIHLINL